MPTENQQQSGTLYENQAPAPEQEVQTPAPEPRKAPEEKTLFSWTAPSRPFKPRNRDFYVKVVSMAILFGVVLFLIDGIMPVLLIVALMFLFYVLNTVKPEDIEYKLTDRGIYIGEKRTDWDTFGRFWFVSKMGADLLVIEASNIAGRLEMMVPDDFKDKVGEIVGKYLVHEEVAPTFFDKAARWANDRLPLE